jgi:ribosomal protein L37E
MRALLRWWRRRCERKELIVSTYLCPKCGFPVHIPGGWRWPRSDA